MFDIFETAALAAGKAIMTVFEAGCDVALKADRSPVTIADEEAERIILGYLSRAFPTIPVIAEESVAAGRVPEIGVCFFLVDPLDGTREFIDRRREFTVNIAYIEDGVPRAGIVYAPALGLAYRGGVGDSAQKMEIGENFTVGKRQPIGVREAPEQKIALVSRCHDSPETGRFLATQAIERCTSIGSSLKFCLLAEGQADIYPRCTPTMEWDTAAGDAVLRAAGGQTLTWEGAPLLYGKRGQTSGDFANPGFISSGGGDLRSVIARTYG